AFPGRHRQGPGRADRLGSQERLSVLTQCKEATFGWPFLCLKPGRRTADKEVTGQIAIPAWNLLRQPYQRQVRTILPRGQPGFGQVVVRLNRNFHTCSGLPISVSPTRSPSSRSCCARCWWCWAWCPRSEEHTSELQSRENLVCRLLLEKKQNSH